MRKVKLTILVEVEYEMNPRFYPESFSDDERLALDLAGSKDDPYLMMDSGNTNFTITNKFID